jgi:hypothetical protein
VASGEKPYPLITETELPVAYQLTNAKTSRVLKTLINANRLKHFTPREEAFNKLHPPLPTATGTEGQTIPRMMRMNDAKSREGDKESDAQLAKNQEQADIWHPAKYVMHKRMVNTELQYLVKYKDNTASWLRKSDVSGELQRRYLLKIAGQRKRQRKAARDLFD